MAEEGERVAAARPNAVSGLIAILLLLSVLLVGTGCGAAGGPDPTPSPDLSPTAEPTPVAGTVPADGNTLRQLGFREGPEAFSIPRTAVVSTGVDQPSLVTLVLSAPTAADVAGYLRRALPATGFTISADETTGTISTLTFTGYGWTGGFTGSGSSSAITLRRS